MCLRIISQESSRRTHRALALICLCISERVRPLAFLCLNQKCEILKVRSPTAIMGAGRSDLTHFRFRQRNARGLTPDKGPEEDRLREDLRGAARPCPRWGRGGGRECRHKDLIYIRPYKAYTASYMAQKAFKGNRAPQRIWELRLPGYWLRIPEPIKGLCVCVFVYVCLLYVLCRLRTLLSQTATASAYAWPGQGPCPMNQLL